MEPVFGNADLDNTSEVIGPGDSAAEETGSYIDIQKALQAIASPGMGPLDGKYTLSLKRNIGGQAVVCMATASNGEACAIKFFTQHAIFKQELAMYKIPVCYYGRLAFACKLCLPLKSRHAGTEYAVIMLTQSVTCKHS